MALPSTSSSLLTSMSHRFSRSTSGDDKDHRPFLSSLSSSDSLPSSNESLGVGFGVGASVGLALTLTIARPIVQLITTFLSIPPSSVITTPAVSTVIYNTSSANSNWTASAPALSSTFLVPSISSSSSTPLLIPLSYLPSLSSTSLLYLTLLLSLAFLYHIVTRPLVFHRPLTPSALHDALRKSYADMPPPYPNAWFKLGDVMDVEDGEVLRVKALGRELTVGRDAGGELWCQDESGHMWEVCETNKVIFVWHDEQRRSSAWQIPIVASDMSKWRFVGRTTHEIICHIQEIPENGADTAHLDYLHGDFVLNFLSAVKHTWQASWTPQPYPNQHLAKIAIDTQVALWGWKVPLSTVKTRITQVGPGIVQLTFPTPWGNILLQETITPIVSNIQRASHVLWCEPTVPRVVAKGIMKSTLVQFERDFSVWFYKRWIRAPLAVKEDGPILKYRRWVKQFFDRDGGELRRDMEGNEVMIERSQREH